MSVMMMKGKSLITLMFTITTMVLIPVLALGTAYQDQDITSLITLTTGGTHTFLRCNIHSGGQIVLTGGGSVTISSSTVTVGADEPPAIIVESVSSPLLFTMEDTTLTSPKLNNSVQIAELQQAGSSVVITGNTFGNMSDVMFTGVADLLPTTSITFKSNSVSNHATYAMHDDFNPFVLQLTVLKMSGGQLLVEGNTGAPSSLLVSVIDGDRFHLVHIVEAIYNAAQAGSITVVGNTGFLPVLWLKVGPTTVPNAEATVLVYSNSAITKHNGDLAGLVMVRLQADTTPRTSRFTISGNNILEYVLPADNDFYVVSFEEMSSVDEDVVVLYIVNNTQAMRDLPTMVQGSDFFVSILRMETSSSGARSGYNATITNNTFDIVTYTRDDMIASVAFLFTSHLQGGTLVMSKNIVTVHGPSDAGVMLTSAYTLTLNASSLVIDSNILSMAGSEVPGFTYLFAGLNLDTGSMFVVTNNEVFLTNTSVTTTTSAVALGPSSTISVLDNTSTFPLFDISFNNISGECPTSSDTSDTSDTFDIFVPPSLLGGFANTTRGTGCHNYVCGVYKRNLQNTSTTGDGIMWDVCPDTTTPAPTTTTSTTINTTTPTSTTTAPLNNQDTREEAITTFPNQPSAPTGLSATSMIVGTVSGALDSAASVQMVAMLSVMACRTDGEDEGTARLFLTPLRIDDSLASADLIGSIVLLVGLCGLYYATSTLVFVIVGKRGPKAGDQIPDKEVQEEGGEQHQYYTEDGAAHVTEMKVFKAKLFLLFPRIPYVVATLLFPGVVFDSCSLLYGTLVERAAVWERVLGGLCLAASIAFCALHVVAGALSLSKVKKQDAVNTIEEVEKQVLEENNTNKEEAVNEAMYSVPATPTGADDEVEHPSQLPADAELPVAAVVVDESAEQSNGGDEAPINEVDPTADPRSQVWFILYSESDRGHHPRFLELLLLPDGKWNSIASRSWYAVVTSLKAAAWGAGRCCSHGLVRMLLISIVAAINPGSALGCDIVQSVIAAISFAHGALLIVARIYRIPVLNPLQGIQSILLGLLALASFIDNHQAQSAFSTTLLVTAILISILSLLAVLLEIRVQRKRKVAA